MKRFDVHSYISQVTFFIPTASIDVKCSFSRSRHQELFCKNDALRNFAKFTGKHLFRSLFFDKEIFTNTFFTEHLWWLLCFFSLFLLIVAKRHFLQELDLFSISGLHQYFNCNMSSVLGLSFCFKFSLLRFYIYFTVWAKMVIFGKIFGFWTG